MRSSLRQCGSANFNLSRKESFDERDLLRALDILLERQTDRSQSKFSTLSELRGSARQEARRGRQTEDEDLEGFQPEETCERTGTESRKREECQVTEDRRRTEDREHLQEVVDIECRAVEVTKLRMEIKTECKTKHDQTCNVTMKEVPTEECQPSTEEKSVSIIQIQFHESRLDLRCDIAFRVVQSEELHDECKVDVQHVCEHLPAPPPSYLPPPSLGQVVSPIQLPSPYAYGCRPVATKTCTKVPVTVAKKEPYEKCKEVMMLNHSILIIVLLYKFNSNFSSLNRGGGNRNRCK